MRGVATHSSRSHRYYLTSKEDINEKLKEGKLKEKEIKKLEKEIIEKNKYTFNTYVKYND